jgi:hypothetical protein
MVMVYRLSGFLQSADGTWENKCIRRADLLAGIFRVFVLVFFCFWLVCWLVCWLVACLLACLVYWLTSLLMDGHSHVPLFTRFCLKRPPWYIALCQETIGDHSQVTRAQLTDFETRFAVCARTC